MRIGIFAVGKLKQGPERELCARYVERAKLTGKPLALTGFDISEHPESRASSADARKGEEGRAFRSSLPEGVIVVLDGANGTNYRFGHGAGLFDVGAPVIVTNQATAIVDARGTPTDFSFIAPQVSVSDERGNATGHLAERSLGLPFAHDSAGGSP